MYKKPSNPYKYGRQAFVTIQKDDDDDIKLIISVILIASTEINTIYQHTFHCVNLVRVIYVPY